MYYIVLAKESTSRSWKIEEIIAIPKIWVPLYKIELARTKSHDEAMKVVNWAIKMDEQVNR